MKITRINAGPRWSDVTVYNGLAHFVEIAEADPPGDIISQVHQVLSQAAQKLAQLGSSPANLLSATIYLSDFSYLAALNAAWEAWLPAGSAPSRACVKVALADPSLLVEIAFVAAVPAS